MHNPSSQPLPKTMQAIVCHGPRDYRLEEVETPQAGPGEVVIRVHTVGICASDLKCFQGAPLFWGDQHREGYCQTPIIPGHEFSGEVVALGQGTGASQGLSLGDMAVSEQIVPCWNCRFCKRGQYWMCQDKHDVYGFRQAAPGAMAEFMKFPVGSINYRLPDNIDPSHAAFIEPLACSIHAVDRGEIGLEDVVVIAGCGPLGLGMVAAARLKNPAILIALDLSDDRLEIAKQCGADLTFNPNAVDTVDEVRQLTEGYGCDVYIEATGHPKAVEQGLHMLRKLGTFVEFSVMREPVTLDWTIIGDTKELNIHGAHLSPYTYPIAMKMIAENRLPMDQIITHRLPLSDFHKGMDFVANAKQSIKVTLAP